MKASRWVGQAGRVLVLIALVLLAPATEAATAWNAPRGGNPLVPGYFADPCLRKFGDTYYLYVTPDGWGTGEGPFVIWSSKDFVHWTSNKSAWPSTTQKWAPSVVYKNGLYYMYTQVPCQVYVATSTSPLGPWTNAIAGAGPMILDQTPAGTITLDGEVFIDTDAQAYLMYGTWWTPTIAKLNADLTSWTDTPIQYFTHTGYTPPKGTVQGCMEAPYMYKRNSTYYYMYSDNFCQDSTYQVKYSTGTTPQGPWTYGANNPILSTSADGTVDGPGHHTMMDDGGKVYMAYHRHDNPHSPDGVHRQTCVDELSFNADGSIAKVVPTHDGVQYLAASTKKDTNLAVGKTASASSNAGADWLPSNAADENNGTLWKAGGYTYPQWLTIDLGSAVSIKRCEAEFEFPQVAYKYKIEYSTNGTTWTSFVNRTSNTTSGCPMVDSVASAVSGRYVRITLTGDDSPGRPNPAVGIWNFKIYDGVDKADPTPVVDAGPDKSGTVAFPTLPLAGALVYATGPTTYTWSKLSGPGTVTFSSSSKLSPAATFSGAGTYVLQLAGNDGTRTGTDTVTYTIAAAGDKIIAYPMDDTTWPYVTDTSGNNQDGILKNGPTHGTGAVNSCLNFDGADDYIYVPPLSTYAALSVCAWVKPDKLVSYGSIICGNGSANGAPYLSIQSDGKVHFAVAGNSAADVASTFAFTSGNVSTWTHVAAVYSVSGKSVAFYINGILDSTRTLTTARNAVMTTGARVGGWDGGGRSFDGKIDELVLYNRTLSAAEVTTLAGGVTFPMVSDAKALADGQTIALKAIPVTYAPINTSLARATTSFYIEDANGTNGLRVEDGSAGQDAAVADSGATLSGTMRTNAGTGERYIECASPPEIESAPVLSPASKTLGNVSNDAIVGILVKVTGATITSIAADRKSMVIADGSTNGGSPINTTVLCEYGTIDTDLAASNMADITGVVSQTAPATRIIRLKSYWRTSPPVDMMAYKLQEYYKFDESSGTSAADQSGNNRTATVSGTSWTAGKVGNCLSFNGTSGTAVIPDMGTSSAITITGWMNLNSLNDWQAIMHCDNWVANAVHLSFRSGGALFLSINGSDPVDVSSGTIFSSGNLNTWKWIAVVYDSSAKTVKFYVNGAILNTVTYNTAVACDLKNGMHLGSWGGGSRFFGGMMDELRFYGRALTDTEIGNLYNSNTIAITATAGTGGTISPSGVVYVTSGTSQTFTITPNPGYMVDDLTVDGVSQGAIASYTFPSVTTSHAISVTFKMDPNPEVVRYRFDETGGTGVPDSSGHGYNGTLNGGCAWASGKFNNGLDLNGTNGYVSLPTTLTTGLTDFTIVTWVKLDSNTMWSRIFDFGAGAQTNMFLTPMGGANVIRYAIKSNNSAEQQIDGMAALPAGSWQQVAVTLSGTTGTLYVNGAQVGQNTGMSLAPSGLGALTQTWIGRSQYPDPYLDGIVDDFKIYKRALAGNEISALYAGASYMSWIAGSFASLNDPNTAQDADPDGDGQSNLMEFALDGIPTSGAASGKVRQRVETLAGEDALLLTLPVRGAPAFSGTAAKSATVDGVGYTIEGSNNLTEFDQGVTEMSPASTSGMPGLDSGWSYRSFRLNGVVPARGATGFLRVRIEPAP